MINAVQKLKKYMKFSIYVRKCVVKWSRVLQRESQIKFVKLVFEIIVYRNEPILDYVIPIKFLDISHVQSLKLNYQHLYFCKYLTNEWPYSEIRNCYWHFDAFQSPTLTVSSWVIEMIQMTLEERWKHPK